MGYIIKGRLKQYFSHGWVVYGLAFGIIGGVVLLFSSHALTTTASINPDLGNVIAPAQIVSDVGASDGKAVKFMAAQSGGATNLPNQGSWTNITGTMANLVASCGDFGGIWPNPSTTALVAGVGQQNLYKSSAGNAVWTQLGSGAGSVKVANRIGNVVYDPANSNIFYEGGTYGGGGVFKTTDGGLTFTQLGNINHVNSIAIDFSDPNRLTLLAGGHEQSQVVYKSSDGGNTWTQIGGNLPGGTGFSQDPIIINASTYLINTYPSYGGGTPGIYRTTNGGNTWTRVSSEAGNQAALVMPNGDLYYSDNNGVVRSIDQGVSWTVVGSNLRSEFRPYGLPDGRLISVDNNNRLVVSADKGSSWTEFGAAIPYNSGFSGGVSYSQANQAVYVWHWDCNFSNPIVLPDSVYQLK